MSDPASFSAILANNARAILGEGPVWDMKNGRLFWVDIEGCRLHLHEPESNNNTSWAFDGMLGAILPEARGTLLLAHEKGFLRFDPANGNREPLPLLSNSDPRLRFNDGKWDPYGNILIGTMDKELAPHAGQLYRVNREGQVQTLIPGTTVSNGMAWTADRKYFYYIDTPTYEVWEFNYSAEDKVLTNKKVVLRIPRTYGGPDGMTIDSDGMLWIAHWGGGCVRRWDPGSGQVLNEIPVPAPQVTSCCFGGTDLDTLFITTARSGLDRQALGKFPLSGGLFTCVPGPRGLPPDSFNLNM